MGRAIHLGYSMGKNSVLFSFFIICGHSEGAQDKKKAAATSKILEACLEEMMHYPEVPKFIAGDLKGNFNDFPQLPVSNIDHSLNAKLIIFWFSAVPECRNIYFPNVGCTFHFPWAP